MPDEPWEQDPDARFAAFPLPPASPDGPSVLWLHGEIDMSCEDTLRQAIDQAIAPERKHLVIDTASLRFIDSSGIAVLVDTSHKLRRRGGGLSIRNPPSALTRLIGILEMEELLPTEGQEDQPER